MNDKVETFLVGFDKANGDDISVCVVGVREKNSTKTKVVNIFKGEDAEAMYELLTMKGGEKE